MRSHHAREPLLRPMEYTRQAGSPTVRPSPPKPSTYTCLQTSWSDSCEGAAGCPKQDMRDALTCPRAHEEIEYEAVVYRGAVQPAG